MYIQQIILTGYTLPFEQGGQFTSFYTRFVKTKHKKVFIKGKELAPLRKANSFL